MMGTWVVYVLQGLLAIGAAGFVLWPVVRSRVEGTVDGLDDKAPDEHDERTRVLLDALQDLEYEHDTGKLDDEEYRQLRAHYGTQLLDEYSPEELDDLLAETADGPPDDDPAEEDLERAIREARRRLE